MENSNETLQKFQHFFDLDIALKQKLVDLAPPLNLSEEETFKYSDKLYKSLNSIEKQLIDIANTFGFGDSVNQIIQTSISGYKDKIAQTDYSINDLSRLYNECFAMMGEKTLDTIRENVFPYSSIYTDYDAEIQKLIDTGAEQWAIDDEIWMKDNSVNLSTLISKCSSVNEILHTFHDYITYDNELLKTISTRKQKSNDDGYLVSLRGNENQIAEQIFQEYDISTSSGDVEVIGFDENNALLMCRDRGHALTIEIQKKNCNEVGIYYFIPKMGTGDLILNYDNLGFKGINSKKDSSFIIGSFVSNYELAATEIMNIIKLTPTDKKMRTQLMDKGKQPLKFSMETQEILDETDNILNANQHDIVIEHEEVKQDIKDSRQLSELSIEQLKELHDTGKVQTPIEQTLTSNKQL